MILLHLKNYINKYITLSVHRLLYSCAHFWFGQGLVDLEKSGGLLVRMGVSEYWYLKLTKKPFTI